MKKDPLKIKVCGMKFPDNIIQVANLAPDYMGFIFYPKSPRNFDGEIPVIPENIKKTGVFVDSSVDFILEKIEKYQLQAIQLHGNESVSFCENLKDTLNTKATSNSSEIEIFKVFGIKDSFDFTVLKGYEPYVNYFLFDTKGKEKGGNGYTFDWEVLQHYPSNKPFILSGGIGIEEINKIEQILKTDLPIYALDLNSKFEVKPAWKDAALLGEFLKSVKRLENRK